MWRRHPVAASVGLNFWGLNYGRARFGLWRPVNPFFVEPIVIGPTVIDYSQPLVIRRTYHAVAEDASVQALPPGEEPLPPGATQLGLDAFDRARSAFYAGDFEQALADVHAALGEMPEDATLHEFRGLVLFAMGRYQEAAAPIHSVLSVGPGWDWTTMVSFYPSVDVYTEQLRALEAHVRQNPDSAAERFLLAYHYITTENRDAAVSQLTTVLRLLPDDKVVVALFEMLDEPLPEEEEAALAAEIPEVPATERLTEQEIIGTWTATDEHGSEFGLELSEDGTFVWSFSLDGETEEVHGVYGLDQNVLVLEIDTGGVLVATLSRTDGGFHFLESGAPAEDPGLEFTQVSQ